MCIAQLQPLLICAVYFIHAILYFHENNGFHSSAQPYYCMQHRNFTISGFHIKEQVADFVRRYYPYNDAHESFYPGGFMLAWEDYSTMHGNYMMIILRFDERRAEEGIVNIEIITGAERRSWFSGNWGSGDRRINKFTERLRLFCHEKEMQLN